MKKTSALILLFLTIICMNMGFSFASENSKEYDPTVEVIVISSEDDLEALKEADRIAYEAKISALDQALLSDVTEFSRLYDMDQSRRLSIMDDTDDFITAFLNSYPEYSLSDETTLYEIGVARESVTASYIRSYFKGVGYELSLALFEHSLLDNPADLTLDLSTGNDSFRTYIKGLLNGDSGFTDSLTNYFNGSLTVLKGYSFSSGDLYYSIHNCDLALSKTNSTTGNFTIQDTYDFKAPLSWLTSFSGCHDFYFEISSKFSSGKVK